MEQQPYGPNTREVRRFLQRFAALGEPQWRSAARAFEDAERTPRFAAADRALAQAIERTDRAGARDALLGPLLQVARDPAGTGDPHPVAAAALGAALALIVGDVLPDGDFDALYAPFAALVPVEEL